MNIPQKIKAALLVKLQQMKAKGATKEDIAEDSFIEMIGKEVAEETFAQLSDKEMFEYWVETLRTADPDRLRRFAKHVREAGDSDSAYRLEYEADRRERGEWYPR